MLKFTISPAYINNYLPRVVGNSHHEEYWIPSEELNEFNEHILGNIEVVSVSLGKQFAPGHLEQIEELKDCYSFRNNL